MKTFILFSILAILISCNNNVKEVADGGSCSYEDKTYPAKLIKIIPINQDEYDAQFKLEGSHDFAGNDTIYYSSFNHQRYIYKKDKPIDSLVIGKQYAYFVKNIISGSCNPHIEFLSLNPYLGK